MSILSNGQSKFFLFLIYWFLIVSYSLFLHWNDVLIFHTKAGHISINFFTTYQELLNFLHSKHPGGDVFSYVEGAEEIRQYGLRKYYLQGYNWAPGIFCLYNAIAFIGKNIPFVFTLLIITSCLWGLFFAEISFLLRHLNFIKNNKIIFFVPLSTLFFPFFKDYYFWHGLLLSSESISLISFFLAVAQILWVSIDNKIYKRSIACGLFLFVSAFFRVHFDLIILSLIVTAWTFLLFCILLKKTSFFKDFENILKLAMKYSGIVVLVYACTTIPVRICVNSLTTAASPKPKWSKIWKKPKKNDCFQNTGLYAMHILAPTEADDFEIRERSGEKIDTSEYKNAVMMFILKNPFLFIKYKSQFFVQHLLDNTYKSNFKHRFDNTIFMFLLILSSISFFFLPKKITISLFIFYSAFFVGTTGFSFIFHFEPRYLYPLKVMILFSSMFFTALFMARNFTKSPNHEKDWPVSILKNRSIAIIGATGNVGRVMLSILAHRKVPSSQITALASPRSQGKNISYGDDETLQVQSISHFDFKNVQIAFFAAGSYVSKQYASKAVDAGALVIDKSSYYRMHEQVPLVVPEVNAHRIANRPLGIIANPNCTTIPMTMTLKPLHDIAHVKRVVVSTYQSVSGAGKVAMDELYDQTRSVYLNQPNTPKHFLKPIAFNVIPHIGDFCPDGFTDEEHKMMKETIKILEAPIEVTATCVRVPVFIGHSLSLCVEFEKPLNIHEARKVLKKTKGIEVFDDIENNHYTTPIECVGEDPVWVSRLRQDPHASNIISYWVCCDNLRKGAALNAVQIAESALRYINLPTS